MVEVAVMLTPAEVWSDVKKCSRHHGMLAFSLEPTCNIRCDFA
jgi:hypothetical protein